MAIKKGEYSEIPGDDCEEKRKNGRSDGASKSFGLCSCLFIVFTVVLFVFILSRVIFRSRTHNTVEKIAEEFSQTDSNLRSLIGLRWPLIDQQWHYTKWSASYFRCQREASSSGVAHICDSGSHGAIWGSSAGSKIGFTSEWNRKPTLSFHHSYMRQSISAAMDNATRELEHRRKTKFGYKVELLQANSAAFIHQNMYRKPDRRVPVISKQAFIMELATRNISEKLCLPRDSVIFDSKWFGQVKEAPRCYAHLYSRISCPTKRKFRSTDGRCNNLNHPKWGAAFSALRRALPPDYDDGIFLPKVKSKDGSPLPGARALSFKVHKNRHVEQKSYTQLLMSWGHFVAHDLVFTSSVKVEGSYFSLKCCLDNSSLPLHPECFPIRVPQDDQFYRSNGVSCLEFSRSAPASSCYFGPREQLNQATHFLDASTIYGSTAEKQKSLRLFKGGLLRVQTTLDGQQLLTPSYFEPSCSRKEQAKLKRFCFKSGDPRVNVHILLTIMHTVWTLQHNNIASSLSELNPNWNDMRLFQEARKILIAQIQHITYNEYLPIILGADLCRKLNLTTDTSEEDEFNNYDQSIHPGIANGFGAAAFRFGHSQLQDLIERIDAGWVNPEVEPNMKYFYNLFSLYRKDTLGDFVRGEVFQPSAPVDASITSQLSGHLFQRQGEKSGLDLTAVDIQRGRDHGIPGYVRWRKNCGLSHIENFEQLEDLIAAEPLKEIRKLYRSVEDIDFFTGGLSELPLEGGIVGPTFSCIIADQFIRLKRGDRFWYENIGMPHSFSKKQLKEIRRVSLSRILCDNVHRLGSIQKSPMKSFGKGNYRLSCSSEDIPRMDFKAWQGEAAN